MRESQPRYGWTDRAKALRRILATNQTSDGKAELAVTLPQLPADGATARRRCSRLQPVDMFVPGFRSASPGRRGPARRFWERHFPDISARSRGAALPPLHRRPLGDRIGQRSPHGRAECLPSRFSARRPESGSAPELNLRTKVEWIGTVSSCRTFMLLRPRAAMLISIKRGQPRTVAELGKWWADRRTPRSGEPAATNDFSPRGASKP